MDDPTITLELAGSGAGFAQPIADQRLWSDVPVAAACRPAAPLPVAPIRPAGRWRLVFRGPGAVEGSPQEVAAWRNGRGDCRVDYADGVRFWVAAGGGRVVRLPERASRRSGDRLVERAVGAPLALALAARGVHLLHASALAERAGGVVAITGGTGVGKSTLAAAAADHPELGLTRVADDILPVRLGPAPVALPHFPQLKLAAAAQYPERGPTPLRLAALVEIEHSGSCAEVAVSRRTPAAALLALVRATVAARLFDAGGSGAHFEACAEASRTLPVLGLRFPSGRDGLRSALSALGELAAGAAS